MKRLSVVILCWNSEKNLKRLLPTLVQALTDIDSEVIFVDNGSEQAVSTWIAKYTANLPVTVKRLDNNKGVAYGRNRGLELTTGEYIWILDDDTEVNSSAISTMMSHLDSHPHTGLCACRLVDSYGQVQESFKRFPGLGVKIRNLIGQSSKTQYEIQADEILQPDYVIGACQLIRRAAWEKTGPLDEKIFYGPEDADFCLRMRRCGYMVDYIPQVSICHHWRRMTTKSPFSEIGRAHIRGLIHFWIRHRRLF